MKVLVVGGGGREHALVWKIKQSPLVEEIYCAPGNAGIAGLATCVPLEAGDIEGLLQFARAKGIDLTVVGPEAPLVAGIVNVFNAAGLKVFGPAKEAAAIEGSKVLAKEIMAKYRIPTARYGAFADPAAAYAFLEEIGAPCVVKADGLAAGKGVIIAETLADARRAIHEIMEERAFGHAGEQVVIEEYLVGEEASILAFTDGRTVRAMVAAQDHKRVFDGDAGPNTGGMGAYAPTRLYTPEIHARVMAEVLEPAVRGLAAEGRPYKGVLYAGLMLTAEGPKVLEFNARFGDPETQPVLMLLAGDLVEIMLAVVEERLEEVEIKWLSQTAACVVLASGGYPGPYRKGLPISGLEQVPPDVQVFHAGTAFDGGQVVTAGGRVLGVAATGAGLQEALDKVYTAIAKIHFAGMHYRHDIGHKQMHRLKGY